MKFLKFVFIFATIGTIILLTGCGHSAEEDKQRIVNWLNDTYGTPIRWNKIRKINAIL